MDWYFGGGIDELVPKDQELPDGVISSSPETISKWETYDAPDKYFSIDTSAIEQQFNFNDFVNEDKSHSTGSSICAGSSDESLQRTALSNKKPDYQLDHYAGIERLDDIFLYKRIMTMVTMLNICCLMQMILCHYLWNSLIENMPGTEDLHKSFCFDRESQYGVLPANNFVAEMSLDSQSNSSDRHEIGSSKYLKTRAFSPSVDGENRESVASPFMHCNSEHNFPLVNNIANELVDEETSLEESVLQELIMVTSQLTDKTRICFRDALYRLAEHSKQHLSASRQNSNFTADTPLGTGHDKNIRSGKKKATESETNAIDRAIANLLFNKMDLNEWDFPAVAAVNPNEESVVGLAKYSSNQPPVHYFCDAMLTGDAEVPMLKVGTKSSKNFLKDPARNMA